LIYDFRLFYYGAGPSLRAKGCDLIKPIGSKPVQKGTGFLFLYKL